ncbi:MAG TPA: PilZ domain-containing protein [bacterium]|nr:PilZ domain-containing protein [bacterium]
MSNFKDQAETLYRGAAMLDLLRTACDERTQAVICSGDVETDLVVNFVHVFTTEVLLSGYKETNDWKALPEQAAMNICFTLTRQQGQFSFHTQFKGRKGTVGDQFVVEMPDELVLYQRRRTYRVRPMDTLSADCTMIGMNRTGGKVRVEDISQEGVNLSFPREAGIRIGATIRNIHLELQNFGELVLTGVVCSIRRGKGERFHLGLRWMEMNSEEQQKLNQYIFACQRIQAKRHR